MDNLILSPTEERALKFLGQGVGPEQTAMALGMTTSAISQLLSRPEFAAAVAEARFKNLSAHTERDNKADAIEDILLDKLKDCLPLMVRPMEIIAALSKVNALKRRGASAPESITNQQTVISLNIPVKIVQQFTTTTNNQVIKAGNQELITVQSGNMQALLDASKSKGTQNVRGQELLSGPAG